MRDLVIGAGSAGAVVAARLSADPNREVVLLEAGPAYPDVDELPFDLARAPMSNQAHDWGYTAMGAAGVPIDQPRGKVVGGSSAVNVCIALRGQPEDYDRWARFGGEQWSWRSVEPVFRRLEDDELGGPHHGQGGPVPIRRTHPSAWQPFSRLTYDTLVSARFKAVEDLNDPASSGVGAWPMNRIGGVRQSTAICYLAPATTPQPHY